jgi:hypothetical protein
MIKQAVKELSAASSNIRRPDSPKVRGATTRKMHQNHANQLSFKEYLKASDVTFSLCNAGAIYAVGSIANRATHNTSFESRPMTYFATRVRLVGRIECASSLGDFLPTGSVQVIARSAEDVVRALACPAQNA